MQNARQYWKQGEFDKALKQLTAAREHCPDMGKEIDAQFIAFTREISGKYEEATRATARANREADAARRASARADSIAEANLRAARRAYANDMAYKSQIALQKGDRAAAYRLAEFAHRYVDDDNPQVTRALVEALYYNDDPAHPPLPWASNLLGHTSWVLSVAFSPDGKRLATGAGDHTAKIWDLDSGKAALTLEGHTSRVMSVAFSPDGKRLATGAEDYTAKIWDLDSGKAALALEGHTNSVTSVAFSPDGKRLATGSWDNTAKIWDLDSGKAALTLEGRTSSVTSVAFSPDGKRLATGASDNTAKIWNLVPPGSEQQGAGGGLGRLAGLTLPQLSAYGLENLLDQQPHNEAQLIASGNIWQIAAFAALYAEKIGKTGLPKSADYERAKRLYQACLASGVDNAYFEARIGELEEVWKQRGGD
jgi:dipeptidyl aminopeptidase/acylaminoacyl peptidase